MSNKEYQNEKRLHCTTTPVHLSKFVLINMCELQTGNMTNKSAQYVTIQHSYISYDYHIVQIYNLKVSHLLYFICIIYRNLLQILIQNDVMIILIIQENCTIFNVNFYQIAFICIKDNKGPVFNFGNKSVIRFKPPLLSWKSSRYANIDCTKLLCSVAGVSEKLIISLVPKS